MNIILNDIAKKAASDVYDLIMEGETDILSAINKVISEAQLQEKGAKFNLAFNIGLDLDNGKNENKLSWSQKQSLSVDHELVDPNQPPLPMSDEEKPHITSYDIKEKDFSVTIGPESIPILPAAAKLRGKKQL